LDLISCPLLGFCVINVSAVAFLARHVGSAWYVKRFGGICYVQYQNIFIFNFIVLYCTWVKRQRSYQALI